MPNMIPGGGGQNLGHLTVAHSIYDESSTKKHRLGDVLRVGDRTFVYAQASEALTAGKLTTAVAVTFTEDTVTVAHPVGTTEVTITASAAIAKDELADGYLIVDEGTGAGDCYRIKSNAAIGNGSTGTVTLYDGLVTAWSTSDTDITLYGSPWRVQESNTGQDELPTGVPLIDVTDEYYFWLQTWGPCGVLVDATGTFGAPAGERVATISGAVAGAVAKRDAAGEHIVGQVWLDATDYTDAQYALVYLQVCP